MNISAASTAVETVRNVEASYDEDFFNDALGLFPDRFGHAPNAGGAGKWIYEESEWDDVVDKDNDPYYPPKAEHKLLNDAQSEIKDFGIPNGTPYVDFGVGGKSCFHRNAEGFVKALGSTEYVGVDFCKKALAEIQTLGPVYQGQVAIRTEYMDLFCPTNRTFFRDRPAFGAINGLMACNAHGLVKNGTPKENVTEFLKYASQLCGHGWLLVTIDTNHDEVSLRRAYDTPPLQRLFLSVFSRMASELPVSGFNASSFVYDPEFRSDLQSWAHMARATKTQDFYLGPYARHVSEGQKIEILGSHKLDREAFEECYRAANQTAIKTWHDETGVEVYLLKDNLCQIPLFTTGQGLAGHSAPHI